MPNNTHTQTRLAAQALLRSCTAAPDPLSFGPPLHNSCPEVAVLECCHFPSWEIINTVWSDKQKLKPKSKVEIGKKKKRSPKSLSSLLSQAGHTGPRFIAYFKNQLVYMSCHTKQNYPGCQVTYCDCIWMQHDLTARVSTVKEQLCLLIWFGKLTRPKSKSDLLNWKIPLGLHTH